ncbi:MAG: putative metal-dependent hydrolase [Cyclobacteriaceae bacterium]
MDIEALKYPIGKFHRPESFDQKVISDFISIIEEFPLKIKRLTENLTAQELNYRYRPEGWTVKQVVHHCADSHMNSLVRFKWTLTEDTPTIKAYQEADWAMLPDSLEDDISVSLNFLSALHTKWVFLLKNLADEDFNRAFIHPEHGKKVNLKMNLAIYAWHCQHHLAHIEQALKHKGQF